MDTKKSKKNAKNTHPSEHNGQTVFQQRLYFIPSSSACRIAFSQSSVRIASLLVASCSAFMTVFCFVLLNGIQFNRYLCNPVALLVNSVCCSEWHIVIWFAGSFVCNFLWHNMWIGTDCRLYVANKTKQKTHTATQIYGHPHWSSAIIIQYGLNNKMRSYPLTFYWNVLFCVRVCAIESIHFNAPVACYMLQKKTTTVKWVKEKEKRRNKMK